MNRIAMTVLALAVNGTVLAAEAELPARRVESVSVAQAESAAPVAAVPAAPVAAAPRPGRASDWLELQASGRVASPVIQGQTPAEQELANQRFLNSYENPIPQFFSGGGSSGSSSSGGGNSGSGVSQ